MTHQDIEDILAKEGIKAEVADGGNRSVIIRTESPVPERIQNLLDFHRPIGMAFIFEIKQKIKLPIPLVLIKWYKDTEKYLT